jgi:hypothetical protein
MQLESAVESLIREVEAFCANYVGENAQGEYWRQTCERIRKLDQLVKLIRSQQNSGANHKNDCECRRFSAVDSLQMLKSSIRQSISHRLRNAF